MAFAIAMAWVEAAVVFYLRTMVDRIEPYQPEPLPIIGALGPVELVRELATLIMLFTVGLLSNAPLAGAVLLTVGLQLAIVYVPAFQPFFHTQPLAADELALAMGLPALVMVAIELEKWLVRRGRLYRD